MKFANFKDTLAFLHVPKSGGTTFEKRLTMLNVTPPCTKVMRSGTGDYFHNGHSLVNPRSCFCPRATNDADQWLITTVTTGWSGGVHAPLVYFKQKLQNQKGGNIYVVTMLRDPIARTMSEFYESFDGWEFNFETPYQQPGVHSHIIQRCSVDINLTSVPNIDHIEKNRYDRRDLCPLSPFCFRSMPRSVCAVYFQSGLDAEGTWQLVDKHVCLA